MSEHTPAPRDNNGIAIRALPGLEFRATQDDGDGLGSGYLGLLRIRFSPVNEWTEINSAWEGRFMERFAPNAWKKTIKERADKIRALFQHGRDPQIGDKPLGPFHRLEEDDQGGYAEVKLLDTSYNRDLLPGLKEGLYGSSHRFGVVKADENDHPERSDHNPNGLKEVTIKEARLHELGPVTFPAYAGATAGVRSLTDDFLICCIQQNPEQVRTMLDWEEHLRSGGNDLASSTYVNFAQWKKARDTTDPAVEPEQGRNGEQDPAPSSTEAAPQEGTSGPERRDPRRKGRYGLAKTDPRPSWAL